MKYVMKLLDPRGDSLVEAQYEAEDVMLPNDSEPVDVLSPLMAGWQLRRIVLDPGSPAAFSLQIERR